MTVRREGNRKNSPSPPPPQRWHPFQRLLNQTTFKTVSFFPKDAKNLELLLRDFDAKGYLDIELVYRLRQKESLDSVKQKIVRKLQQNESAVCFEDVVLQLVEAV